MIKIDGNTITVKDDGTGESSDGDGMKKTVILANRNIGYTGECGPMKYEVQSLQIAKIEATGDTANMLGLKPGQKAALFSVQLRVENTSNEDMSWSPDISTIVTSDKEQVSSDWLISDSVGGEFYGNVVKQGQIFFLCKNTDAENLSHIQWRIDTPHDSKYNHFGEDVIIEFEFSKYKSFTVLISLGFLWHVLRIFLWTRDTNRILSKGWLTEADLVQEIAVEVEKMRV